MERARGRFLAPGSLLAPLLVAACSSGADAPGGPCSMDCALVETQDACLVAVCNEGQHPGPVGECVVVNAPDGNACDDGLFCTGQNASGATGGDACLAGACVAGAQNHCGLAASSCQAVTCDEQAGSCSVAAANEGASCDDLPCQVGSVCTSGQCVGAPVDCGALDSGCLAGVCNAVTGLCEATVSAPPGSACFDGIGACQAGACLADGTCAPSDLPAGTPCSDLDPCTANDACDGSGTCVGTAIPSCATHFEETFETCPPPGWTLGDGWACGAPTSGPAGAFAGTGVIATGLGGPYANNLSWNTSHATTPPVDLGGATSPVLSLWAWWNTESAFDGWHVEISSDGGATFAPLLAVTPPYPSTVASQPAWSGDASAAGWQSVLGDLGPFAGQTVILRFAFRSDGSLVHDGVYLDEVRVSEANAVPLVITTSGPLAYALATLPFSQVLSRAGGSPAATWSIVGGSNHAWLAIDPATGELSGTPLAGNVGTASVTVRVEEPTYPSNADERTYALQVFGPPLVSDGFEAPCPGGWSLSGDWQCGTPTSGPGSAYSGAQCIATALAGPYSASQPWGASTATSPAIDLTTATAPRLLWKAWLQTEGSAFDGTNLKISADGGATWEIVTGVTPAYALTIDTQPAWGGNQSALGWQRFEADLTPWAGQQVQVRFDFRSDASVVYPGVYVDDVFVVD